MLKELIKVIESKFQVNIEDSNNKLKLIGFKYREAKLEMEKLAEKVRIFDFPSTWDDTMKLFTDSILIKNLDSGSEEYLKIE